MSAGAGNCPQCGSADVHFRTRRGDWVCDECEHAWQQSTDQADGCGPSPSGPPVRLRIFLSYGRDAHAQDARRIRDDLERRGHEVWFDADRLKEGRDWESHIEEGLKWCDKVVLLMTPYSVRRRNPADPASRDGYCLNEIAKALERNKLIIPVLLVGLEPDGPPTSICRVQYLDLRDAVPIADREERYRVRFDRLVRAIEADELDFEGGQARLLRQLRPLTFEAEIGRHVARFHGRRWLIAELDGWLRDRPDSRVFWLMGGPGVGKSAVAAYLCHTRRDVIAYHLCVAGHDDKADPRRALLSIAYQLSQHLPEYERRLQQLELESEVLKNAATLFDNLFTQPLAGGLRPPDGPRVVVVDAIDEASRNGRNEIAEFVRDHWDRTPPWLRLFVTSRPEAEVVTTMAGLRPHVLDAQGAQNIADLRDHLTRELTRRVPGVAGIGGPGVEAVVQQVMVNSGGLFLYAAVVLEELENGLLSADRLDEFPVGLAGYYRKFFRRQFPGPAEYAGVFRPLLEAICAQREPLPLAAVAAAVGASAAACAERLARVGSLFPVRGGATGTVSPFHKSLRDWLTTRDEQTGFPQAGPYAIDLSAGHGLLADAARGWDRLPAGPARRYFLRYGPAHLTEVGRIAAAVELVGRAVTLDPPPADSPPAEIQAAARALCLALADCPPAEASQISADLLTDVVIGRGSTDFDVLVPAIALLRAGHPDRWPDLRRRLIESERWTVMYATSFVLAAAAEAGPGGDAGRGALDEITALADSAWLPEQELGLYAVKMLAGRGAAAATTAVERFARSKRFIVRAVIGEALLTAALSGGDVRPVLRVSGMTGAWWPYHRAQNDDVSAVQAVVRREGEAVLADAPGAAAAYRELAETFRLRDELLASGELATAPALASLLKDYESIPSAPDRLRQAAADLRQTPTLAAALRVWFGHPSWEVRAVASSVAATVAAARPEVDGLVDEWLSHPDWRVRYAAVEAAFYIADRDGAALFDRAVRLGARDGHAWVRGITADCLSEWIVHEDGPTARARLERFRDEARALLHDTDMWALESMQFMVRMLREKDVDAIALLGGTVGGLLGQIPGWDRLHRSQLQPALNAVAREAAAE